MSDREGVRLGPRLVHRVHVALAILVTAAWGGALLGYFLPLVGDLFLICGILTYFWSQVALMRALKEEIGLSEGDRARLRTRLIFFGPAAVAQMFLYIHFPNGSFSRLL